MFSGPKRKTSAVIRLHPEFSGAIQAKNLGQKIDTAERERDRTTKRDFVPQIFGQTFVCFCGARAMQTETRAPLQGFIVRSRFLRSPLSSRLVPSGDCVAVGFHRLDRGCFRQIEYDMPDGPLCNW